MAMGMLVVPTWNWLMKSGTPGKAQPRSTPIAIARKIQAVRYRSRNESRLIVPSAIE